MNITETAISGLYHIRPTFNADERGHFGRMFCRDTFRQKGIDFTPLQTSVSFNTVQHTLRGMHWQAEPHGEQKLVRVTRGAIFDVIVDMRANSPTRHRWLGFELSADNCESLLIGHGLAHGFVTLEDASEVFYMMDAPFVAEAARGARFDDPAFGIVWPVAPSVISERDRQWPLTA